MITGLLNYFTPNTFENDFDFLKSTLDTLENDELECTHELLHQISRILKKHYKNRVLCILCSHIISCIALEETHASMLIECGAIKILCKVLKYHQHDGRVVWKSAPALWNLFRPQNISQHIPNDCAEIIFTCLVCNVTSSRAVDTTLGALSNLSLVRPELIQRIMTQDNLVRLKLIMRSYKNHDDICGHFGALVANMCVHPNLAKECIRFGYVHLLFSILKKGKIQSEESIRHIMAALHNLADVPHFTEIVCKVKGVELLTTFREKYEESSHFIQGVYELANFPFSATTSLHVASACCDIETVAYLLKNSDCDINELDLEGKTACDNAWLSESGSILELLVASGAEFNYKKCEKLEEKAQQKMRNHALRGKYHKKHAKKVLETLVKQNTCLIKDMGCVVTDFIPGPEKLLVLSQSKKSRFRRR